MSQEKLVYVNCGDFGLLFSQSSRKEGIIFCLMLLLFYLIVFERYLCGNYPELLNPHIIIISHATVGEL